MWSHQHFACALWVLTTVPHSKYQRPPPSSGGRREGEVTAGTFLQLVNANAEFKPKTLLSDLVADSLLGMLCKL